MLIHRIYYKIKDFPSDIKHYYQRAKKGYSYQDIWSIDCLFMEIMPKMLNDLKKTKHGCPTQFLHNEDGTEKQDFETGLKEWENEYAHKLTLKILNIHFCF